MSGLTVGSLFSGVGGFDLGLERAGHRVVWQVEADARCRSVLRRHWPATDIYEDVCHVGGSSLAPVDLVCGGFPCQDLSVAGQRAGLDGERSGPWFEYHRIVRELAPTWVLVENVPGLRSSQGGRDLAVILRGLVELGYVGAGWSLDSQYLGLAQRRERIFLLACRDPRAGCPAEVLSLAEGVSGHPAPSRKAGTRVARTLEARASSGGYDPGAHGAASGHVVTHALSAREAKGPDSDATTGFVLAHTLRAEGFDAGEDGTGRGTPIVAYRKAQKAHDADDCERWEEADAAGTLSGHSTTTGELVLADPICANEQRTYTHEGNTFRVRNVVGTIPRRLTPRECERLQGFPDDWTRYDAEGRELADGPRYRMMGNAVSVDVPHWIGRALALSLHRQPLDSERNRGRLRRKPHPT